MSAAEPRPVRAVWTDFGGVLTPSGDESTRAFCAHVQVAPEMLRKAVMKVTARYGTEDAMEPLDTPLVTEKEWAAQVERVLAEDFGVTADLRDFGAVWFADRPVVQEWLDWLRRLKAHGLFVGMLSNMPPGWDPYWRRMVPPEGLFEQVVVSHRAGARKPMRRIFEIAAEAAGATPGECLLVDDMPVNCEGAVAAGWRAVRFTDPAQAIAEVAALLDLDPLGV
ncbi:HAD family phosphatase [Streptomyces sp. HPF1205]|uniref:HAD family hydrolase n=1 Tax=Streptomyces sp. HPF1205 TaxID=2873262 RepID=UPI001CEC2564|nr:HAD family phosphatase [Streptomyces sp. HPF1205]